MTNEKIFRRIKTILGIRAFQRLLKIEEDEYLQAIKDGAEDYILPEEVEETGAVYWKCSGEDGKESHVVIERRIELGFEYTVWKCPHCGKLYAFRISQPEEQNEDYP